MPSLFQSEGWSNVKKGRFKALSTQPRVTCPVVFESHVAGSLQRRERFAQTKSRSTV